MSASPGLSRHIILCGLNELGFRILEELNRLGERVVVVAGRAGEDLVSKAQGLSGALIRGDYRDEAVLRAAGAKSAASLILTHDDDVGNLHAALAVQEINPRLRIVMRMFNPDLGRKVEALFRDCLVLDYSAIAAPAFVSAALHHDWEQRVEIAGRILVVREARADADDVLVPLARISGDDEDVELFPQAQGGGVLLCLADGGPSRRPEDVPQHGRQVSLRRDPRYMWARLLVVLRGLDRRLVRMMGLLLVLFAVSMLVFEFADNLNPIDAAYFTITIITTTGFGDINLLHAPTGLKLFAIGLMLVGATVLTIFYALITDAIVSARLERALGGVPENLHDHIVVCGLGNIGYRVVEQLAALGVPLVAAEKDEDGRFVPTVRNLHVPVLIDDARVPETLHALSIERARCLVMATSSDIVNLEAALNARSLNPDLRIVLRLFDPDFADRVERAFDIHISRSVAALAAPAFVAAALGRRVIAPLQAGPRLLLLAQAEVESGSWAEGESLAALEERFEGRVVLVSSEGYQHWRPSGEDVPVAGQKLVVVATRAGLDRLLERTEAGGAYSEKARSAGVR